MAPRSQLLLCLLICLMAACTPARQGVEGNIARRIRFEGNGGPFSGHNDLQLRRQMEHGHTSWGLLIFPFSVFVDPVPLRPEVLPRDAYRLEMWYAQNGWFNARINGWRMVRVRPETPDRAGVVDIVGMVEPGPPSLVRGIAIRGLDRYAMAIERTARREGPLQEGSQFNMNAVDQTRQMLVDLLRNQAYAYAQVEAEVEAWPEELAVDVTYQVDQGISAVYGPIAITGNDRIRERHIRQSLRFDEGEAYRLDELGDARRRLFQMGTFSLVNIEPDLSDPSRPDVPIHVSVTESRFRTLRLGAGLQLEGGLPRPRVSAHLRHTNLFNQLIRMELDGAAGAAIVLSDVAAGIQDVHPTYLLGASFTYPRIAGERLALELNGRVRQDIQTNFWLYRQIESNLQFVWTERIARTWTRDDLMFRVGPHVEEYRYLDLTPEAEEAARRLFTTGTLFVNPYRITALDQQFTLDWRDDPLRTTRGSYWQLMLREAFPLMENGSYYLSGTGEARVFRPLSFRREAGDFPLIAAGRLRGTYLHALSPELGIPYPELAFLGGPNSIRGFRSRQVGPYDTLCVFRPGREQPIRYHLPHGGTVAVEGSAEVRYPWAWGATLSAFLDAGFLERDLMDLGMEDLRWSVGTGFRYDTPVGPLRVDLSFRQLYPEDAGPQRFINCDCPDFQIPRAFDLFSSFLAVRDGRVARPPFAMVFFIAIGEAF